MESVEHYVMECKESNLFRIVEQKCIEKNIKPELQIVLNNEEILNLIYEKITRKIWKPFERIKTLIIAAMKMSR